MEKMGQNFHICLRSGRRGLRAEGPPTPPPVTVNLTVKYPCFYDFPWVALKKLMVNFRTQSYTGDPPLPYLGLSLSIFTEKVFFLRPAVIFYLLGGTILRTLSEGPVKNTLLLRAWPKRKKIMVKFLLLFGSWRFILYLSTQPIYLLILKQQCCLAKGQRLC